MPRLYKPAADGTGRDADEGGAFERFIASAIATLVTILLSWRILLELGGSDGDGGQRMAAAGDAANTAGDDQRSVSDQQATNVVLDMMESPAVTSQMIASAADSTAKRDKRLGRSERINKVYDYLNLTVPDHPGHPPDTDTQSLGDTSSEDDAVTVIEKPISPEEQAPIATYPVETAAGDVIDVSRCRVGFATCAEVTSSQAGCERIWPEQHGGRVCNRDYAGAGNDLSRDNETCIAASNTDIVTGNKIPVADDDVTVARSRNGEDNALGQATVDTLTGRAMDINVLWPSKEPEQVAETDSAVQTNSAGTQNNMDNVYVGDIFKHACPKPFVRDTQPCSTVETTEPARVITKLVIPEVFQHDMTSLPAPIVPLAVRDDCVNAIGERKRGAKPGAGCIYDFTGGADMHMDDVEQTRDTHPLNLTAAASSVTFGHSSSVSRASTCSGDSRRATSPGINSAQTPRCAPLLPAVFPECIATDAATCGGINRSLQRRFYFTSFCDRVNDIGAYADARLSSCVEAPPNRCVFVKTEFIVHDYRVRNTNVVQLGRLTESASDTTDVNHDPFAGRKTAPLEPDHKTNNMKTTGYNTNTRAQSATQECTSPVDLYNPRCKVRCDIGSIDTSPESLLLGMGHMPNSASAESSVCDVTTALVAESAVCSINHGSVVLANHHPDNPKMIPETRSRLDAEQCNGKADISPRRLQLTGVHLPAKQLPWLTTAESDIHAMYRDGIISHKGQHYPAHLASANRSTGNGDNTREIHADISVSEAGISYAGRGGPTVAAEPMRTDGAGDGLSDAGVAVSLGASPSFDNGHPANGAGSHPRSDSRGYDFQVDVRNCRLSGQRYVTPVDTPGYVTPDRCTVDSLCSYVCQNNVIPSAVGGMTNIGLSVGSHNQQDTATQRVGEIPHQRSDVTGACALINPAHTSEHQRPDRRVNGNTHSVYTHPPSAYERGDVDAVHYSADVVATRRRDRTRTARRVTDTQSHARSPWTGCDANINTAIRPATEQLQPGQVAHDETAPELQVSAGSILRNSFVKPDVTPIVTSRDHDVDSWVRVTVPDHNASGSKRSEEPTGYTHTLPSQTGSCQDRVKLNSATVTVFDEKPWRADSVSLNNAASNPKRPYAGLLPDRHGVNTDRRTADSPEVRHPMKGNGAIDGCTNVVPMVTTSARRHDNAGTRIKSILKGSPSAIIDSNRCNDAARGPGERAEMDVDDRFSRSNGRRNGDEDTNRFDHATCARAEPVTTPTRLKVFEIEYTDTAAGVSDAAVMNGGGCYREQCDDTPVLPTGGCGYNYERPGDSPQAGDVASLAYDAIDPIGYRYSPDGYRRGGGGGGGGGGSVCSSVGSGTWRARSMTTLACEFFADRSSRTSLLETDLDTGEQRATPLVRETDIDYARSMTDLAHPAAHARAPTDDIMTRSLVALPGDQATTPVELTLSANELRIRRSLSKLSVPQWYSVAASRQNRDVIRLKNVERAGVVSSPRRSLHLSTPNIARHSARPVVINYRVKTPLGARSPVATPTDEFELPSAKFRKHPSTWARIETRPPPPPEGAATSRSAREAYLRLKREQEGVRGRDCRDGHLASNPAGETAQGMSGSTRSCRSVLTTPPGSVTEASIRARAAGISEGARRHSGGKGSYPVMGTRINLAEFGNKSAKPDVDGVHPTSNGHHSVKFALQQPRSYHVTHHNAVRGDVSTARYDSEAKQKQMEEVLDSLLGIPSALPVNNISPSSTPLRYRPAHATTSGGAAADASGDDDNDDVTVTCRNPKCGRQASLSEARTCYKTCHNCYTYYCSRVCRQAHWQRHKRKCVFSRVGSLCKNIIRKVHDDPALSAEMTRVARSGYLANGRGCVKLSFPSQIEADSFLGCHDNPVTPAVFVSLTQLKDNAVGDEHFFELTDLCKTYNPQVKYVIDVAVTATVNDVDDVPRFPPTRSRLG